MRASCQRGATDGAVRNSEDVLTTPADNNAAKRDIGKRMGH